MSKPRNGNRKCPNCKHYFAAHSYAIGTNARPCVVPGCNCACLQSAKVPHRCTHSDHGLTP